jgi:hypothetical protein
VLFGDVQKSVIYILGDVNAVQLGALGGGERKVCQGVALIPIRAERRSNDVASYSEYPGSVRTRR